MYPLLCMCLYITTACAYVLLIYPNTTLIILSTETLTSPLQKINCPQRLNGKDLIK